MTKVDDKECRAQCRVKSFSINNNTEVTHSPKDNPFSEKRTHKLGLKNYWYIIIVMLHSVDSVHENETKIQENTCVVRPLGVFISFRLATL